MTLKKKFQNSNGTTSHRWVASLQSVELVAINIIVFYNNIYFFHLHFSHFHNNIEEFV